MSRDGNDVSLDAFNEADRADAIALLRPCLDVQRWCQVLADARPYATVDELAAAGSVAATPFTADEIEGALAQHPRIGERSTRPAAEAALSASEQAGVDPADAAVAAALAEGNRVYEQKFGRVFLIRAAGRSANEILGALNERLGHSAEEELPIVAEQLREIAVLRLKGRFTT